MPKGENLPLESVKEAQMGLDIPYATWDSDALHAIQRNGER